MPAQSSRAFRGDHDFYRTPAEATWALAKLGLLPTRVWECACGDGAMARVLATAGHDVVATDLIDRGFGEAPVDFLAQTALRAPAVVTNPPFKHANRFARHALDLGAETVALFLSIKFLAGGARYEMLHRSDPPHSILVFIDRVKFFSGDHAEADQPGWNTEDFAWFVWRRGNTEAPRVLWTKRDGNAGLFG